MDERENLGLLFDKALGQAMMRTLLTGEYEYLSFDEIFLSVNHLLRKGITGEVLESIIELYLEYDILLQRADDGKNRYALQRYSEIWRIKKVSMYCLRPSTVSFTFCEFLSILFPPPFNIFNLLFSPYNETNFWLFQAVRICKNQYGKTNDYDMDDLLSKLAKWARTGLDSLESGVSVSASICWMEYVWKLYQKWNPGIDPFAKGSFGMFVCPPCPLNAREFLARVIALCRGKYRNNQAERFLWGEVRPIHVFTFFDGISVELNAIKSFLRACLGKQHSIGLRLLTQNVFTILSIPSYVKERPYFKIAAGIPRMENSINSGWNAYLIASGKNSRECPYNFRTFILRVIGALRNHPDMEKISGPADAWPLLFRVDLDATINALICQSEFELLTIRDIALAANGGKANGNQTARFPSE